MLYDIEKNAKTLELPQVLLKLADFCILEDTKETAARLVPLFSFSDVQKLLAQTEQAYSLIARYSAPPIGGVFNMNSALSRAELGASLTAKELLGVAAILRVVRSVKQWRDNCSGAEVPDINDFFLALAPNKYLEEKITLAIKSEDEISDTASPLLADIRRKITAASSKIRDNLDRIVRGPSSKYLQDAIVTQRDGRFVVPVRAEFKGEIKGIIHDTSSTGSTVFIEPISVVEANNEVRVLKSKEADEIARILAELSADVAEISNNIKYSYSALCSLDLIFAKAKLAFKMGGAIPKLNDKGRIYLKRARHPLISQKTVVPITVELGREYDQLIITGPNTGGKTVTLKTVGLFTLMIMCGLMIPVDDNSEIAVFSKVFADIGDEQSIEQSLSTFSSHMVNIVKILSECDENSLVLFDELCAGTDPIEGAALAKSILMNVASKGAKCVSTTHYPELKAYALDTAGVENASCEFDVKSLKPTYRLIIGVPGRSNAFAISKRLGLSEEVIEIANNQLTDDDLRFERVVRSLEAERQKAEKLRQEAAELKAQMLSSKKQAEALEHEWSVKRDKLMEQTREKANAIISNARERSAVILNELEEIKKGFNSKTASEMLSRARADYKRSMRELEDTADPVISVKSSGEKLTKIPKEGDIVVVSSFNRDATVVKVDEKGSRAFVMSGSMKMWIDFDDLRIKKSSQSTEIKKTRNVTGLASKKDRIVSGELDIRGMASDEAILELDRYIDNAVLSGITNITIIHGKGTGVLRKAVQAHLRSHKNIKTFRIGLFGEGENGVTIAEIAE